MAATMCVAPSARMAATVASSTPATAPRQPAWAAPTTPAPASQNSTGAQSAVTMPRAMPGWSVTRASARGPAPAAQAVVACTTAVAVHLGQAEQGGGLGADARGRRGHGSPARRRATSCPDRLQFRLAYGPVDTPPRRVKKPCGAGRAGERTGRAACGSGGESGQGGQAGWQSASALNRRPMRLGSARRWAALTRAAARWAGSGRVRAGRCAGTGRARRGTGLADWAVDRGAGVARGRGEGGEVHMGGEVGGAGQGERVGRTAVGDGLERVARGAVRGRSRGTGRRRGGRRSGRRGRQRRLGRVR